MTTQVSSGVLADGSVTTAKFDAAAVCPNATTVTGTGTVGTTQLAAGAVTPAKLSQPFTHETAQNTTSGTSIDFTGIPGWARRITMVFNGVSVSGTANLRVQLGTGGTPETTGYNGNCAYISAFGPSSNVAATTSGFDGTATGAAAYLYNGALTFVNVSGNVWVVVGTLSNNTTTAFALFFSGQKSLGGTLNMLRLTTTNGTDTFDAGTINIHYE